MPQVSIGKKIIATNIFYVKVFNFFNSPLSVLKAGRRLINVNAVIKSNFSNPVKEKVFPGKITLIPLI